MPDTLVTVKPTAGSQASSIDLSSYLVGNEIATTLSTTVQPVTTPPLLVSTTVATGGTSINLVTDGGAEGTTYGTRIEITTSGSRTFTLVLATLVQTDVHVPYVTTSPYTFQSLVDRIEAGDSAMGKAVFVLPTNSPVSSTNSQVIWTLMDKHGKVFANGNAFDYSFTNTTFSFIVEASGVVHVPSGVPPSLDGERYQIRWELLSLDESFPPQYMFENIQVLGLTTVPEGALDTVELVGDPAQVSLVLTQPYTDVAYEVFQGNIRLTTNPISVRLRQHTSSGWYYEAQIDTTSLRAGLDPFAVSWKYSNTTAPWAVNRSTSRLFVVNPSILIAVEDMKSMVSRAQTTMFQFPDVIFSPEIILSHLRTGRDDFNAAAGVLTQFDMSNATGAIRSFWLAYSYISVLRSQYIAEGEKAFDFQGQAISLNVDRTQYYQTLASDIASNLQNDVKPFKQNLLKKGMSGGDGDMGKMNTAGSVGALGLSVTPASMWARAWPLWGTN